MPRENVTQAGLAGDAKQQAERHSEPTLLEVVEAFREEIAAVRREQYEVARKVYRFDSAFEQMFQQEATDRLQLRKGQTEGCDASYSPLSRIRDRLMKNF